MATEILGGSDSEMGSAEYLELIGITNERRENTPEKKKITSPAGKPRLKPELDIKLA